MTLTVYVMVCCSVILAVVVNVVVSPITILPIYTCKFVVH